jgi:uncharacterized membrane protein YeiH
MGETERNTVMAFAEIFFTVLEVVGTVSFAISGAMAALEKRVDLFGVIFLGATTALDGGIIRDVLVGKIPPSAFSDDRYMVIAVVTAVVVFLIASLANERYAGKMALVNTVNNVFDAAGLGAFTITGAKVAMNMGYMDNGFFVVFLAMVTGVGGGILRDLMIGEIPFVLRKRIYAVASILGGVVYYQLLRWQMADMTAAFFGIGVVFGMRMLATIFKWNLPKAFE